MNGATHTQRVPDVEMIADATLGTSEWTIKEVEHLRECALALVRSHNRIDVGHIHGFPRIITTVDGRALWDLMGALDGAPSGPNRDRKH